MKQIGGSFDATLDVSGDLPITCQWQFNGADIPGATNLTLSLTGLTAAQAGTYTAHLSNAYGSTDSNPTVLSIDDGIGGAVLLANSGSSLVYNTDGTTRLAWPGYLAQLYAGPVGGGLLPMGAAIPFQTGEAAGLFNGGTRHIASVPAGQTAQVQVRVWESGKGVTYEEASTNHSKIGASEVVSVVTGGAGEPPSPASPLAGLGSFALTESLLPQLVSVPGSQSTLLGSSATLQVVATGLAPLSYQWLFQGNALAGANAASLSLNDLQAESAGDYAVVVANGLGSVTSSPTTITIQAGLLLQASTGGQLEANPAGSAFSIGQSVQLTANPSSGYLFDHWTGDLAGSANPATLVLSTNRQVGAVFVKGWSIGVAAGAGGAVAREPNQALYPEGSSVVVTATPSEGFAFTGWTGGITSQENPLTVVAQADLALVAGFRDATSPVITLTSPVAGSTPNENFVLRGSATDNVGVTQASWTWNGTAKGDLTLVNGQFEVTGLKLQVGENRVRVVAADAAFNNGSAEIVITWVPSRLLTTTDAGAVQEGRRIEFPVVLTSDGDVAGSSFVLHYDQALLADPQWNWDANLDTAIKTINLSTPGEVRATFSLPAVSLSAGNQGLGSLSFRARSVPAATTGQLTPEWLDVSDAQGNRITFGSLVRGGTFSITPRKIRGDDNGNDRLDIGDATVIQRFVTGIDLPQAWDVTGNDLNQSTDLDSGDVIKVLRVVVGLDDPPSPAPPLPGNKVKGGADKPSRAKDGQDPVLSNVLQISADAAQVAAGQRVTVQLRLQNPGFLPSGAAFKLTYATNALRLVGAASNKAGNLVPAGSVVVWNVAPAQNDFTIQSGRVSFAAINANAWSIGTGLLAELTFEVQPGATDRYRWWVQASNAELTRDGYSNYALADTALSLTSRAPLAAHLDGTGASLTQNGFQWKLSGEAGETYRIEASTDLKVWVPVGTVVCQDGPTTYTDTISPASEQRFYRAIMLP